jgi:hypothetical protein
VTQHASIEFAGLQVEFRSTEAAVLELVRGATAISSSVTAGSDRRRSVLRADLRVGREARWVPGDEGTAAAESPLDELAFVAVLRAAMCQALAPEGALLHAAGASIDGQGFLFVAPSEGGKTTVSGLLSREAVLLSDETICVRPDADRPGRYAIYGTCFWSGPVYPSRAGAVPLKAVCFLRKGALSLTPLSRRQALRELLAQLHLPIDPGAPRHALAFADRLVSGTPAFALTFALDSDPVPLLRALREGQA